MTGVIALLSLYALLVIGGLSLASRLKLGSALGTSLMTFTFGAAQLVFSIQLLSLFYQLNGVALLLLNAGLTLAIVVATRRRNGLSTESCTRLPRVSEVTILIRKNPFPSLLVALTLACIIWFVGLGFLMFPMTDTYHFAMPLFWKQHATVFPYPAANPRLTGVVFASEALAFPGVLYSRTNAIFLLLGGVSVVFTIWTVTAISTKLAVSFRAAIYAGLTFLGYGVVINTITGGSPDPLLATMWFAASLYFLLGSRTSESLDITKLGCSVLCLLMACGTKNVVVLQFPAYALGAVLLLGWDLLKFRVIRTVALWGAAGLICSSVLWSYTSNLIWFGTPRGHIILSETVSTDMRPAAIWTRISRATVSVLLDPVWLPSAYSQHHKDAIRTLVRSSGAQETLPEDHNYYYSFSDESLKPAKGLGFLGLLVFVPGLIAGAVTYFRRRGMEESLSTSRRTIGSLVVVTVVSFLTFYTMLRWQQAGVTRLMLTCLVAGLPLCGLLLENRWWRVLTLILASVTVAMFSVYNVAMVSRRVQISPASKLAGLFSRLQRDRSELIEYQWTGEAPASAKIRENYSSREYFQLFLSRVPEPASIGVIGKTNTEEFFAFGETLSNRVVPLIDSRSGQFLQAPADVEYITVQDYEADEALLKKYPDFEPWLRIKQGDNPFLTALRRRGAPELRNGNEIQ